MAAVGAVLPVALKQQIHERAAADARDLAQRIADGVIDEHLRQKHFEHGLDGRTLADIDLSIETLLLRGTIENAKIYDGSGRVVYALQRDQLGAHEHDAREGVYEVYVPLDAARRQVPGGGVRALPR